MNIASILSVWASITLMFVCLRIVWQGRVQCEELPE